MRAEGDLNGALIAYAIAYSEYYEVIRSTNGNGQVLIGREVSLAEHEGGWNSNAIANGSVGFQELVEELGVRIRELAWELGKEPGEMIRQRPVLASLYIER